LLVEEEGKMSKNMGKILLFSLCAVAVMATAFSTFAADGQFKLAQTSSTTFPIILNSTASYVLTSNLMVPDPNVNAITISADNVTLDLNGHALIGPGSGTGTGIYAIDKKNITVRNGTIRGFGYEGIYIHGSTANNRVKDISAYDNGRNGIEVLYATITNCTSSSNGALGIKATYSTITGCMAYDNSGLEGIWGKYSTINSCTAISNEHNGIGGYNSTVTNCTAYNNLCSSSNQSGIYAINSSVTNSTSYDNGKTGFDLTYATLINCTANSNGSDGIYAWGKCHIVGNNCRDNEGYGINLVNSYSYVIKNSASNNTSGNFNSVGTDYMPITGDNANYGW
jgi:hypothetical protein